jgi:hypothetical protein
MPRDFRDREETFRELWEIVQIGRQNGLPELFRNGLDAEKIEK